jgi:hypothetical protein
MSTAGGAEPGSLGLDHRRAALRAEIEQTRAALGETVSALAAKADVKARAQEKADEVRARMRGAAQNRYSDLAYRLGRSRERVSDAVSSHWPLLVGAAASLALLATGLTLWRGRR